MPRKQIIGLLCLLLAGLIFSSGAWAGQDKAYTRTLEKYEVPDVMLINQDGVKVSLRKLLSSDNPVLVDFIYTTCTTICPVLSINFANFQKTMVKEKGTTRLISISIDPEFDTPMAMKAYLKRYHAKQGWDFLTGSRDDISRVLKSLNAFTQNKMSHLPVILLKKPSDGGWVRIYGLIGASELMREYEMVRK